MRVHLGCIIDELAAKGGMIIWLVRVTCQRLYLLLDVGGNHPVDLIIDTTQGAPSLNNSVVHAADSQQTEK
jgi:hypothetical protein